MCSALVFSTWDELWRQKIKLWWPNETVQQMVGFDYDMMSHKNIMSYIAFIHLTKSKEWLF